MRLNYLSVFRRDFTLFTQLEHAVLNQRFDYRINRLGAELGQESGH